MISDKLDKIDKEILNLLQNNARMTYSEIGVKVGLSRVAIKNRITALENNKIITGYRTEINSVETPGTVSFYALLETKPDMYDSVTEKLKNESVVKILLRLSGNNLISIICTAQSNEERSDFARRVRNSYEGVTSFATKDIWEVVKGNIPSE